MYRARGTHHTKWVTDLPLPTLCTDTVDRDTLITQQELDESLGKLRQMVDRDEMGYTRIDGVLIHRQELEGGQEFDRIVVPKPRRKEVLKLAHSSRLKWTLFPPENLGCPQTPVHLAWHIQGGKEMV